MSTPEPDTAPGAEVETLADIQAQNEAAATAQKVADEKLTGERLSSLYKQAVKQLGITEADFALGHQPLKVRELFSQPGIFEIDYHKVGHPPVTYTFDATEAEDPIVLPVLSTLPVR